jgi:hypothetical protein
MGRSISRTARREPIEGAEACRRCNATMVRYQHAEGWQPRPNQSFFFRWWDVCSRCRRIQHYGAAKQWVPLAGRGPIT